MSHDAPLSRFLLEGRWRFQSQLGFGADGTVYLALDEQTGAKVAVKVYDSLLGRSSPSVLRKLQEEVDAARAIASPHLVRVIHHGVALGDHGESVGFVVMEYLEGESLREKLEQRITPMSAADAVELMRQVLLALGSLHRSGYVHRDLKPENVFVLSADAPAADEYPVKLFDLGAVRPIGEAPMGSARGTPIYVAPEIASRAEVVDERCDVYSAGIMLFELLMGRPPLDPRATAEQLVAQHVYGSLDPLPEIVGNLPLGAVYAKATTRDLDRRFRDADAFLDALHALRPVRSDRLPANSPFSSPSVEDSTQVPIQPPVDWDEEA